MDHTPPSEHITAHAPTGPAGDLAGHPDFTPKEWQAFRHEDFNAGRNIVGLMAGIFIVGLLLYSGVAWWVSTWPA
jgi:hypothetical protein